MLVDRGGLWYGEEIWCLRDGGRNGSSWWREIARIREGVGALGGG
ncbi:hypothetical protein A2U01_0103563, partial [Trifolium medium]|nr:hypothetical protein [Trifolium medium]